MERFTKIVRGQKVERKAIPPPPVKEIIFCISLYYPIPPNFKRQNILYKHYLGGIFTERDFYKKVKNEDLKILKEYLGTYGNKKDLARKYFNTPNIGESIINKYLHLITDEIKKDFESGNLEVKKYQSTQEPVKEKLKKYRDKIHKMKKNDLKYGETRRIITKASNKRIFKTKPNNR